ncbi:hypothetical protein BFJ63_vAg2662 [Fusarium oxysporum f. sp. narcissi]|uniref:Uncharacterized protein n=1 Tax=Fusarium oxysporum f. sp. narcissi TaxID=451672 RepID=A0A4Q2W457_FUSOX|nr:hypothetical protein BFJ63_vAg2662 [Fusarium oxysporum f. sp. narcissi]
MEPNMFVAHQHSNHQHFANPLPSSLRNCPSFSSNDIARLRVIGSSGVDAVKPKPFFAALSWVTGLQKAVIGPGETGRFEPMPRFHGTKMRSVFKGLHRPS